MRLCRRALPRPDPALLVRDGSPIAFVTAARSSPRQADGPGGTRLTGHPWGLAWSVASGADEPGGWETVRRDSVGSVLAVGIGGSRYALALEDGRVLVRTLANPSGEVPPEGRDGVSVDLQTPALRLELSSSGDLLVTVDRAGRVEAWDVPSGARRWSAAGGRDPHLAIAPDGLHVVAVSDGTTAVLFDAQSGAPVASWAFPRRIEGLLLTADGEHLVVRMEGRLRAARPVSGEAAAAPVRRRPSVVSVWRLR